MMSSRRNNGRISETNILKSSYSNLPLIIIVSSCVISCHRLVLVVDRVQEGLLVLIITLANMIQSLVLLFYKPSITLHESVVNTTSSNRNSRIVTSCSNLETEVFKFIFYKVTSISKESAQCQFLNPLAGRQISLVAANHDI